MGTKTFATLTPARRRMHTKTLYINKPSSEITVSLTLRLSHTGAAGISTSSATCRAVGWPAWRRSWPRWSPRWRSVSVDPFHPQPWPAQKGKGCSNESKRAMLRISVRPLPKIGPTTSTHVDDGGEQTPNDFWGRGQKCKVRELLSNLN